MEQKEPKSLDVLAQECTDLAAKRTIMAADRTLMAWLRTAIAMIGVGFTIYGFKDSISESPYLLLCIIMALHNTCILHKQEDQKDICIRIIVKN